MDEGVSVDTVSECQTSNLANARSCRYCLARQQPSAYPIAEQTLRMVSSSTCPTGPVSDA